MKIRKTCLLLTMGAVLSACGHTAVPALSTRSLHAQEECHGCGLLPETFVNQFWEWRTSSSEALPVTGDGEGSVFLRPRSAFETATQGSVLEERSGLVDLRAHTASQLGSEALPLACMGDRPVAEPETLTPEDGRWSGRVILFTPPVDPSMLSSHGSSDALCGHIFGPGWQVFTVNQDTPQWAMGTATWQNALTSLQ